MRIFGVDIFQSGGTYSSLPSVPKNEIVLFDKDTVVLGYSLLTDDDDGLVYITKGAGAGGNAGGAAKTSSTWTQPNHTHGVTVDSALGHTHTIAHTHTTGSHTLTVNEIPTHTHNVTTSDYGLPGPRARQWATGANVGFIDVPDHYGITWETGGGLGHDHGATSASSAANSGSDGSHAHTASSANGASANTWRPLGRCFTRQQRV